MNLLLIGLSSFILALSGALVPGPLFTVTVTESVKRGFRAGPLIILGHGLLEIGIVLLLVFNVAPFLAAPATRFVISLAGGIILAVMGGMLLKDARKMTLRFSVEEGKRSMNPVITGIIGSVSNPYWTIWWATIGLGYLMSSMRYGIAGVAAFFIGHITADISWYSGISYAVSKGTGLIGEKGYRYTLFACGIFLIFFGCWFLTDSLSLIRNGS